MQQLQSVFNYEGAQVRTIVDDLGNPWFVAGDVCAVLEIDPTATRRLDSDEKNTLRLTQGNHRGNPNVTVVNESGLYSLILGSRKPEAKEFKRWVTHDVLPTLRKAGKYEMVEKQPSYTIDNRIERAERWIEEERERIALAEQVAIAAPKVEAFDTFLTGENAQTMNEVAKSLQIGRNTLFGILRDRRVIMANNLPYQNYIKTKHFRVKQTTTQRGLKTFNNTQTLVTAKGIEFIRHLLEEIGFYDGTMGKPRVTRIPASEIA